MRRDRQPVADTRVKGIMRQASLRGHPANRAVAQCGWGYPAINLNEESPPNPGRTEKRLLSAICRSTLGAQSATTTLSPHCIAADPLVDRSPVVVNASEPSGARQASGDDEARASSSGRRRSSAGRRTPRLAWRTIDERTTNGSSVMQELDNVVGVF